MSHITGTVRCLSISDAAAFTTIEESGTGTKEIFILWWLPGTGGGIPNNLTSFTRIMHSMWVSLLREARSNALTVTIVHPSGSAEVTAVRLGVI